MYAWLWHRLPGSTRARAGTMTLILLSVVSASLKNKIPWA